MRAELYRPDQPDDVVAVVRWDGTAAHLEPAPGAPANLDELLRPTPVVDTDPALRRLGTHGETLLQPGTLAWFRSAVRSRGRALGLAVRFVPGVREGGWDPAAQYRTFEAQVGRLSSPA